MVHGLFQPDYEHLQSNVLGNFCSEIYNVGLFQKLQKACLEPSNQGGMQLENHSPLVEKNHPYSLDGLL